MLRLSFSAVGVLITASFLAPGSLRALPDRVVHPRVPHVLQKPDFCGEACVSMALQALGRLVSQDAVFRASGLDPALGRGCWTPDLFRAIRTLGIATPSPWIPLPPGASASTRTMADAWGSIRSSLARGDLVVVCTHFDQSPRTTEHFRLLVGYDDDRGTVIYHDPALENGEYLEMPLGTFFSLWPLSDGQGGRFLVRFVLPREDAPGRSARPRPAGRPDRDRITAVHDRLPPGFIVQEEDPFVIASDVERKTFDQVRTGTIRWAFKQLSESFFHNAPFDKDVTFYLFKNEASYRQNARRLFGEDPSTPFGYYSPAHEALVMNIATGGGTLVHEMVHPMIAVDFPEVPAWFNEGLASLFEQCSEVDGRITGLVNWRFEGLRDHLARGGPAGLSSLMGTTTVRFYGSGSGLNYAKARYLLYWLQEEGVLRSYYQRFRTDHASDPTGVKTLLEVLGESSMARVEERWLKFLVGIRV